MMDLFDDPAPSDAPPVDDLTGDLFEGVLDEPPAPRMNGSDLVASLRAAAADPANIVPMTPDQMLGNGQTALFAEHAAVRAPNLADRFVVPPFSVLNMRTGDWQERRRRWIAIGIRSELGRGGDGMARAFNRDLMKGEGGAAYRKPPTSEALLFKAPHVADPDHYRRQEAAKEGLIWGRAPLRDPQVYAKKRAVEAELGKEITLAEFLRDYPEEAISVGGPNTTTAAGTSIFDPVVCELVYRWWCPRGGRVLDPFAGGSVRGIVAAALGLRYDGVDLSERQVAANREQWPAVRPSLIADAQEPVWHVGDAARLDETLPGGVMYDLVFSCPPYGDLEVYSDDPKDLSVMPHKEMLIAYRAAIAGAVARLREDRFAVFVVGDFRDTRGFYRNFVGSTVEAFEDAGAAYYNEGILEQTIGSLPVRVSYNFPIGRKLGRTHQTVLCFFKGDPRTIARTYGGELDRA